MRQSRRSIHKHDQWNYLKHLFNRYPKIQNGYQMQLNLLLMLHNDRGSQGNHLSQRLSLPDGRRFSRDKKSVSMTSSISSQDYMHELYSVIWPLPRKKLEAFQSFALLGPVHVYEFSATDFNNILQDHSVAASKITINIARILTGRMNHLLREFNRLKLTGDDMETRLAKTDLNTFKQQVFS